MPKPSNQAKLESTLQRTRALVHNALARMPGKRPPQVVVDLHGPYPARTAKAPFFGLPIPAELRVVTPALEDLERDLAALGAAPWVKSVVLRMEGLSVDWVTAQALRRLVGELEEAGKETIAYLSHLTWTSYYVASAAKTIAIPESADFDMKGLGVASNYYGAALEHIGVRFEKLAIGEYKSAFENFIRKDMSAGQREQLSALLESLEAQFVGDVADARRLSTRAVRDAIDEGLTSAAQAARLRFIDRVAYEDEIIAEDACSLRGIDRHLPMKAPEGDRRVAVVSVEGTITTGKSRRSPLPIPVMGVTAGSETVIRCLRAAERDPMTAAIVLHVDSGGGSALASDLIAHEVNRIGAKKPIVAVMGKVAASGGYYVLAGAAHVMAAAGTVTGSIGVLTGKLSMNNLYARYGVVTETLQRGKFALMDSAAAPFTDEERALLERANAEVYERFITRVAEGRKMSKERVDELGRGRVWSGADALKHGLVDELGDVGLAIKRAAELAKISPRSSTWNVSAPKQLILPNAKDPTTLAGVVSDLGGPHYLMLEPFTML